MLFLVWILLLQHACLPPIKPSQEPGRRILTASQTCPSRWNDAVPPVETEKTGRESQEREARTVENKQDKTGAATQLLELSLFPCPLPAYHHHKKLKHTHTHLRNRAGRRESPDSGWPPSWPTQVGSGGVRTLDSTVDQTWPGSGRRMRREAPVKWLAWELMAHAAWLFHGLSSQTLEERN